MDYFWEMVEFTKLFSPYSLVHALGQKQNLTLSKNQWQNVCPHCQKYQPLWLPLVQVVPESSAGSCFGCCYRQTSLSSETPGSKGGGALTRWAVKTTSSSLCTLLGAVFWGLNTICISASRYKQSSRIFCALRLCTFSLANNCFHSLQVKAFLSYIPM